MFDLIRDNEEAEEYYPDATSRPNQLAGESVLGKRPKIELTATAVPSTQTLLIQRDRNGEDDEDVIPIPENGYTQRRTSGRVPKRT